MGPGRSEHRKASLGVLPNPGEMKERAVDLVQYLSAIASGTDKAHKEMQRSHMLDG